MTEQEAIKLLENFDVKYFLKGGEQSDFIIEKANKVNKAIEEILRRLNEYKGTMHCIKEDISVILDKIDD